jgi:SnoaL-like domain
MSNGDRRNDISGRDRQGGRDGAPAEVRAASVRGSGQDRVVHEALATQLRGAFNARDIDALHSLLAEGATWGEDPSSDSFCRDRNDIIRHLKQLLAEGVRATIVETTTGPRGIAAHVEVEWPEPDGPRPDRISISQVYVVTNGLITEIHGHDDKDSALAAISD